MTNPKPLPRTLGDLRLGEANSCPPGFIMRRAYTTKAGVEVARGCVPDVGEPGKTPARKRVLPKPEAGGLKGWSAHASPASRRRAARAASKRDGCGTALKRLSLLANFTKKTSPETHHAAKADMEWLRRQKFCHLKSKAK